MGDELDRAIDDHYDALVGELRDSADAARWVDDYNLSTRYDAAADALVAERALADDLAAVLAVLRDEVDPWFGDQATEVLARYREARQ